MVAPFTNGTHVHHGVTARLYNAWLLRIPLCRAHYKTIAAVRCDVHCCCRDGKPTFAVVLGEVVLFHIADAVAGHSPSGKLVVEGGGAVPTVASCFVVLQV